ncbi:MAG: putative bifunctional diguanylate cyclase/phosphodiesterase [Lysobacteraceae bacterium]|jgi:diguanylate cyclase (GGDEF)-like protein|nr:EAL domain-containing protein [Silanimonas sp.]
MPLIAFMLCLLMGAFAFATVLHVVAGLGDVRDRRSLLMAGVCALSIAFNLMVLLATSTADPEALAHWNKLALVFSGFTYPLLLAFFDEGVARLGRAAWAAIAASTVLLFVAHVLLPYGLQFESIERTRALVLPWGETIHVLQGRLNPWFALASLYAFLLALGCIALQWLRYRRKRETAEAVMLAGAVLFAASGAVGVASRFGLLDFNFAGILGLAVTALFVSLVHVHDHRMGREREARERLRQAERLEWLALHDPATGLPNRGGLDARVASRAPDRPAVLALLGIDHLGRMNEAFGHRVGDALVRELAHRTRRGAGQADFVARLTGDKFAMVIEGEKPEIRLDAILAAAKIPVELDDGLVIETSMSGGFTRLPSTACALPAALQEAESALVAAKETGRGRWMAFDRSTFDRDLRWSQLASQMREGLRRGEFRMVYQPRLHLADESTAGFEALMRWAPVEGPVSPAEFIRIAEESGFILDLGRWGIETAFAQRAAWCTAGLAPGRLSINLSPRQLFDPGLADFIADRLAHHGHGPDDIEFEITESVAMERIDAVLPLLQALAGRGFHLAMDDFGTGYSSLSRLQELPFDVIKVDLTFVRRLGTREGDELMSTLLGLIRTLGRHSVAEGIETATQRDWLRGAGCMEVQGYLFSKPLEAGDAGRWLVDRAT